MHVLYCCNDDYCPYTGISIVSLFENNKNLTELVVYIAGLDISSENRLKLEQVANEYKREIIVIDAEQIEEQLIINKVSDYRGNKITFYRLFIDQLIPDKVERLLYIDGDTVIVDSLEELETFGFEDNKACAMIRERVFKGYNTIIGIKESDNYYNAGVTLFNMITWRSLKCSDRLLAGVREGRANYHLADQDLLCSVINENIQTLPVRFNVHSLWLSIGIKNLYWYFDVDENNLYSIDEIHGAIENPAILHCSVGNTGTPWQRGNKNPFKMEWEEYKKISPWKDMEDVKAKRTLSRKARWIMFNALPRSLYLKIFKYHNVRRLKKLYGKGAR